MDRAVEDDKIKAFLDELTKLTIRHKIMIDFGGGDNFDLVEISNKFDGYSAAIEINGSVIAKADFIGGDDPHRIEARRPSNLSAHQNIEFRLKRS